MGQDAAAMLPQLHLFHGDCDKVEESIVEKDPDFEVEKSLKQDVDSNTNINIYIYICQYSISISTHINTPSTRDA